MINDIFILKHLLIVQVGYKALLYHERLRSLNPKIKKMYILILRKTIFFKNSSIIFQHNL